MRGLILFLLMFPSVISGEGKFDHFLIDAKENGTCYLVCAYDVKIIPHGVRSLAEKGLKQLEISVTVVDVVKGKMTRGEKLKFRRYTGDLKLAEKVAKKYKGSLLYLFQLKSDEGEWIVDPQDPRSSLMYGKEIESDVLRVFKKSSR